MWYIILASHRICHITAVCIERCTPLSPYTQNHHWNHIQAMHSPPRIRFQASGLTSLWSCASRYLRREARRVIMELKSKMAYDRKLKKQPLTEWNWIHRGPRAGEAKDQDYRVICLSSGDRNGSNFIQVILIPGIKCFKPSCTFEMLKYYRYCPIFILSDFVLELETRGSHHWQLSPPSNLPTEAWVYNYEKKEYRSCRPHHDTTSSFQWVTSTEISASQARRSTTFTLVSLPPRGWWWIYTFEYHCMLNVRHPVHIRKIIIGTKLQLDKALDTTYQVSGLRFSPACPGRLDHRVNTIVIFVMIMKPVASLYTTLGPNFTWGNFVQ